MGILAIEHIVRKAGDQPRIAGRGIKVRAVVELHQAGWNAEDIAIEYDLTPGQIYAALSYYYDHQKEIDQDIARSQSVATEALKGATSSADLRAKIKARHKKTF